MNAKEIRENSMSELNDKLAELKDELYKLRFQHAINLHNVSIFVNICASF